MIGTRPEAIKMAPVAHALAARGLEPSIVLSGQHSALEPAEFGLGGFAVTRLHCAGQTNPHRHVSNVSAALLPYFIDDKPDLLLVQGDTSTALGAALAGFTAGVPIGHVEAGLRTHDFSSPWPEEEYRCAIDAKADLLFAPTELAAANLHAENVSGDVHVTGNSGIDALLAVERALPPPSPRDRGIPRVLATCHRRESWGSGVEAIAAAASEIAASGTAVDMILPPNSHVAATLRRLLDAHAGVSLVAPCGHAKLIERIRDCALLLSDSGGIQEEAPTLGVPLLILRDKTERPEAIASGNALLVGTSAERIAAEALRLLRDPLARAAMSRRSFPFGDGHAGDRVAQIVYGWLQSRIGISQMIAASGTARH